MAVSDKTRTAEIISHGELRMILTELDPEELSVEIYYRLDEAADQDFRLQFSCGDEGREFSTRNIIDKTDVDGWTSAESELDASKVRAKEFCTITAISEGDGEVVFSTPDKPGKMIFTWKVLQEDGTLKAYTNTFTTDIQ
jgi:hypothetical protein